MKKPNPETKTSTAYVINADGFKLRYMVIFGWLLFVTVLLVNQAFKGQSSHELEIGVIDTDRVINAARKHLSHNAERPEEVHMELYYFADFVQAEMDKVALSGDYDLVLTGQIVIGGDIEDLTDYIFIQALGHFKNRAASDKMAESLVVGDPAGLLQ